MALVGWEVIAILLPIGSIDAVALSYAIIALLMVLGLTLAVRRSFDNRHSEQQRQRQAISLVRERERLRFAGDLHDILGHSLTVITMKNELAQRLLSVGKIAEASEQIPPRKRSSRPVNWASKRESNFSPIFKEKSRPVPGQLWLRMSSERGLPTRLLTLIPPESASA